LQEETVMFSLFSEKLSIEKSALAVKILAFEKQKPLHRDDMGNPVPQLKS
jgi:hypothetical protein